MTLRRTHSVAHPQYWAHTWSYQAASGDAVELTALEYLPGWLADRAAEVPGDYLWMGVTPWRGDSLTLHSRTPRHFGTRREATSCPTCSPHPPCYYAVDHSVAHSILRQWMRFRRDDAVVWRALAQAVDSWDTAVRT